MKMRRRLGNLERQLFAYAQMRGLRALRTGDLVAPLGITPKQERELYTRLAKSGLIAKVRRGLYLIPARLPLGTRWAPDEGLVLNTLLADRGGRYQVCGPNAFNRYGFDDQIPARLYAYNNRFSERRSVAGVVFHLIKVADERLGDTEEERSAEGETLVYSSRARTLFDAVYDWSRFNGLPRAYGWIRRELAADRVTSTELADVTLRYGNLGTTRRMGALLEREGASERVLRQLEQASGRPANAIPWVPSAPRSGAVDRRWGVLLNG